MSQINVNAPPPYERDDASGDRAAAAGINLITVLIVLAVLAVLAWFLFTGPLQSITRGASTPATQNPPAQQQNPPTINVQPNVNVNPPASGSNGSNTGSNSSSNSGSSRP